MGLKKRTCEFLSRTIREKSVGLGGRVGCGRIMPQDGTMRDSYSVRVMAEKITPSVFNDCLQTWHRVADAGPVGDLEYYESRGEREHLRGDGRSAHAAAVDE